MKKYKFTQGDWIVKPNMSYVEVITENGTGREMVCNLFVYDGCFPSSDPVKGDHLSKESFANAKLIAAAPKMLEALENLENDKNQIPDHAWKMVQDAIKLAIG